MRLWCADGKTWRFPEMDLFREASGGNVDPVIERLENGIVVLSYGRPTLSLRFSEDSEANRAALPSPAHPEAPSWP